MIPFSKESYCPKCRSNQINKEHSSETDSLTLTCTQCKYTWTMESFSARTERMKEHSSIVSEFRKIYKNKEVGII